MPLISTSRLLPVLASVVLLLPSLAMAASPTEPPPTFPTETEAQQHCSGGLVVWLDVPSRIYYLPRSTAVTEPQTAVLTCVGTRQSAQRCGRPEARNEPGPGQGSQRSECRRSRAVR